MRATTIVWWMTLVALIVVLALAVARVMRAIRELKRITRRIDAYADLPLAGALRKAGNDAARLQLAAAELEPLIVRARAALVVIRRGPVPPDVVAAIVRIGVEVQALQEFVP